ncbi:MAG TPA: hypothetical protein VMR06_07690 [Dokdonella sp.]|uniref:hypothetical protein n=1 Tax=Dokdonella sp. TaxID=2291710 RepID=UPI002C373425|nr:hypothetical protein [Dokdonella sp.]HUD41869.1 hypothetical protein [Dokdonella sp.]
MSLRSLLLSSLAGLGLLLAVSAPVCARSIPFGLGAVAGGDSGIEPARTSSPRGGEPEAVREGGSGGYLRSVGTVSSGAAAPALPALPAAAPAAADDGDDDAVAVRPVAPVRATLPGAAGAPAGERKTGHRWQSLVPGAIK